MNLFLRFCREVGDRELAAKPGKALQARTPKGECGDFLGEIHGAKVWVYRKRSSDNIEDNIDIATAAATTSLRNLSAQPRLPGDRPDGMNLRGGSETGQSWLDYAAVVRGAPLRTVVPGPTSMVVAQNQGQV